MPYKIKGCKAQRESEHRRNKRWAEKHPERRKAATANYKRNNKQHVSEYNKSYYRLNNNVIKPRKRSQQRRYNNEDPVRAAVQNRKSKWLTTAERPVGPFDPQEIRRNKLEQVLKESKVNNDATTSEA
jgi:hypothetical protein